ncbi:MAG: hypothetical protein RL199_2146 [Pseudomonadota bacterium]|jgi:hypothetical protein
MARLSIGLKPEPSCCRVLVLEDMKRAVLRAVLPGAPRHPAALGKLCEALSLWWGTEVSAAVCANDEQIFSEESSWCDAMAVDGGRRFSVKAVVGHDRTDEDFDAEMGSFDDVRAFVCRWCES